MASFESMIKQSRNFVVFEPLKTRILSSPLAFITTQPSLQLNRTMAYSYDEDTKVHQLLFGCRWKAVKNDSEYSVATSQGRFTFNIQKACDVYAFVIRMDWTDVAKLSVFQSCTVSTEDGIQLSFSKFKFVLINNIHQHGR